MFQDYLSNKGLSAWILGTTVFSLFTAWITIILWKSYKSGLPLTTRAARLSLADGVTLGRGLLIAGAGGFLFLSRPVGFWGWLPGSLYLCAVFSDYADGYLARRKNSASDFGAALDRNVDALATLVGSILGITWGILPAWYVIVGFGFYIFSCAAWVRKKRNRLIRSLPYSNYRRIVGATNTLYIGFALLPFSPTKWVSFLSPALAFLVLWSFWKDWRYVSSPEG
jgi:CDP-diacylglycerol--glycerol-3-phosphate 3-phosphatidyltransferase